MEETHLLLSGILAITHPKLYQAARILQSRMRVDTNISASLDLWNMPFSAVSLMSNRQTPLHRDDLSLYTAVDILLTTGEHSFTSLSLGSLGYRLWYMPGTAVVISGRLVAHGVSTFDGARLCNAYYFREVLFRRFGIRDPGFMDQASYADCHGPFIKLYLPDFAPDYIAHI